MSENLIFVFGAFLLFTLSLAFAEGLWFTLKATYNLFGGKEE